MIGKLDQRVTLRGQSTTSDGLGGLESSFSDIAQVWASVTPKSGTETLAEGRTNASGTFVFKIRNRSDVNETSQIIWGGETYNIRMVHRRGGRQLYLDIEAERGV